MYTIRDSVYKLDLTFGCHQYTFAQDTDCDIDSLLVDCYTMHWNSDQYCNAGLNHS